MKNFASTASFVKLSQTPVDIILCIVDRAMILCEVDEFSFLYARAHCEIIFPSVPYVLQYAWHWENSSK